MDEKLGQAEIGGKAQLGVEAEVGCEGDMVGEAKWGCVCQK